MKTCSICSNKHYGLGYCHNHYNNLKRHNDPLHSDKKRNRIELKRINERKNKRQKLNNQGLSENEIEDFAGYLKAARIKLGYTYIQMGELLDTHRTNISRWERGLYVPFEDVNIIKQILDYAVKKLA